MAEAAHHAAMLTMGFMLGVDTAGAAAALQRTLFSIVSLMQGSVMRPLECVQVWCQSGSYQHSTASTADKNSSSTDTGYQPSRAACGTNALGREPCMT